MTRVFILAAGSISYQQQLAQTCSTDTNLMLLPVWFSMKLLQQSGRKAPGFKVLKRRDEHFCLLVKHHTNCWKSNGLPKKKRSKFHLCGTSRQTSAWCHATTVNISSVKNTALASRGARSGNCSCPLSTCRIEWHLPAFPPLCATCHRRENIQNNQRATSDSRWTRSNFTVRRFGRFLGPLQTSGLPLLQLSTGCTVCHPTALGMAPGCKGWLGNRQRSPALNATTNQEPNTPAITVTAKHTRLTLSLLALHLQHSATHKTQQALHGCLLSQPTAKLALKALSSARTRSPALS